MDDLDTKIILELQRDGRASFTVIAQKLALSEAAVRKRVKKLLDRDLLKITALPNLYELGFTIMAIIGMQVNMSDLRRVGNTLAAEPSVCYVAFVAGRYDLMALVVAKSHVELSEFIEKKISVIPSVSRTETFVNLDVIKGRWSVTDTSGMALRTKELLKG